MVKKAWMFRMCVFLFLMSAGLCFAAQAGAAAAAPAAPVAAAGSIWGGVLKGILAGALAAGMGYLSQQKAADGTHEAFDVVQFVATIIVGILVGAYSGWKNLSLMDVENLPILSSVIAGVELVLKVVWRNGSVKLADALATLQSGTKANPTVPPPTTPPKQP